MRDAERAENVDALDEIIFLSGAPRAVANELAKVGKAGVAQTVVRARPGGEGDDIAVVGQRQI